VRLQHRQGLVQVGHGAIVQGGVGGGPAQDGVVQRHRGHLHVVGREVDPRVHLRRLKERAAGQVRVAPDAGNVPRDGVGLKQRAAGRLQHGQLAGGVAGAHRGGGALRNLLHVLRGQTGVEEDWMTSTACNQHRCAAR